MGILGYFNRPGLLGRLSRGRLWRACLVLVVANLVPVLVCGLLWLIGIQPAFDGIYWIPATLATIVLVAGGLWLLRAFGFWGVGSPSMSDGGDQFDDDFTPMQAFGLGWLRLVMQVVMIGGSFVFVAMLWAGVRWWHFSPSAEMQAVPEKAASIPVPKDWHQTDVVTREPPLAEHHGTHELVFDIPKGDTFGDVQDWFESAPWASSFGRLRDVECKPDIEQCTADVVARDGEEMSYRLEVWYLDSSVTDLPPTVRVDLGYDVP